MRPNELVYVNREWPTHHCEIQHMWQCDMFRRNEYRLFSSSQLVVQSDYLHLENKLQEYSSLPHLFQINSYNDAVITAR